MNPLAMKKRWNNQMSFTHEPKIIREEYWIKKSVEPRCPCCNGIFIRTVELTTGGYRHKTICCQCGFEKIEQDKKEAEKEMNDSEMAVLISEKVPSNCETCLFCTDEEYNLREAYICVWEYRELPEECYNHRPDWCPYRKAIGIIEPGNNVRYFGEEGE